MWKGSPIARDSGINWIGQVICVVCPVSDVMEMVVESIKMAFICIFCFLLACNLQLADCREVIFYGVLFRCQLEEVIIFLSKLSFNVDL